MPRVIHFELPADDPTRAVAFYEGVFGWSFQRWDGPMDYWLVTTGPGEQPGIDGGLMRRQQPGASPVNVIDVASLDQTVTAIERAGGRVVVPRMAVQGIGWVAYFLDTEQNMLGLMQPDPAAA
ncbi:MAG: VOC family protein [Luteitalea sp.]|nr:VOC family protein [Luteitalea sp.]